MNFDNKYLWLRWRLTLYSVCSLFLLVCHSCALKEDADFDFPKSQNNLMVEAYLCPDNNYQLVLMESNNLSEELFLNLNWDAKVYIYKGDEKIRLLNILNKDDSSLYMYNYGAPQDVPLLYDGDFKLEIETSEGCRITGFTPTVTPILINEVKTADELIDVSFLNDIVKYQRYYLVVAEGICDDENVLESQYLDFSGMEAGMITAQLKGDFSSWESVTIKLYHITKENFEFQESIIDAHSANQDPFTVPAKVRSNLEGAIGIFTYYTVDSLVVR